MAENDPRRGRRGYHHGNLRAALLEATRALIAEKGPNGFTVAEAARQAGVSPSAPYRHFTDREALLRAVATEGYAAFAERLENAWSDPGLTPLKALDAVGRAYLGFARDEPASFAAMFEAGVELGATPELKRAADHAFAVLQRAVDAILRMKPPEARPPSLMVALHIWSMSHGVATLFGRGDRATPMTPEDLLESLVGVYLQGLGLTPKID